MDRVELGIKLEQMNTLRDKGEFEEAAKVADTIEWRKIKRWSELSFAADVYEAADRLKDARNVCVYAYNRNLGGKRLIYRLAELSVKIDDLDEAEELYKEFIEEAPRDTGRFILLYKISVAKEASTESLIEILEEYKQNELEEQYEYELAVLYAKAGRIEECVRECDDLILWFSEGEYVEKAMILKSSFVPLTEIQQKKFYEMQHKKAEDMAKAAISQTEENTSKTQNEEIEETEENQNTDDINVKVKDYNVYDTQNLQAEIAKSMSIILEGMAKGKITPEDEAVLKALGVNYEGKPMVRALDDASPKTEPAKPEVKVSEPTKEIRLNAHYWNKNSAASDKQPDTENFETEENRNAIIEGQIDIMDWLNSTEDYTAVTMESETKSETELPVENKTENTVSEECMVEELTQKLIKEVQADLKERTVTIAPDEAPEEEYIPYEAAAESQDDNEGRLLSDEEAETKREISDDEAKADDIAEETSDNTDDSETVESELTDSEKKFVRKYFGIEGMKEAIVGTIRGKKSELCDGTSAHGNIVVTGKADTDRAGFAINLFKALHADENTKQLKIAKTTSAALNKKGILSSANKIKGTTLIVENAGTLSAEAVKELTQFMLGQTESMLVIITGEDYSIYKLFRDFPTFAKMFEYTLELKNMSVNDLVDIAKEYANEKGYAIDENALLKVYMLIDGLQMTSPGSEIEEVKKLVDEAIERCDNSKWPFGRKYKGLILLKEKHFS